LSLGRLRDQVNQWRVVDGQRQIDAAPAARRLPGGKDQFGGLQGPPARQFGFAPVLECINQVEDAALDGLVAVDVLLELERFPARLANTRATLTRR
jgi:hypothetical protein